MGMGLNINHKALFCRLQGFPTFEVPFHTRLPHAAPQCRPSTSTCSSAVAEGGCTFCTYSCLL